MADRGRGRGRGRGGDRGGGPGGGAGPARGGGPPRGGAPRGGPPSVSSAGTGATGGRGRGGPPSVSSAGTGFTGGRGRGGPTSVSSAGTGATGGRGGGGRGGGGPRGGRGGAGGGGTPVVAASAATGGVFIAPSVRAVGCKRPSYGTLGVPVDIIVNCFRADTPTGMLHHYDAILPEDKVLPPRVTVWIIRKMQEQNPTIFTKRASYDGRKNLYSPIQYSFGDNAQFEVTDPTRRNPWRVRIQFAAMINPASLERYIQGQMSHDEMILTTLNACNVAIRMQPIEDHPFNARSFFTRNEFKDMGRGVELWRGYFQSVRPAIGRMMINLDISSAAFYKSGSLIKLCLEYLGRSPESEPTAVLTATRFDPRTKRDLLKFIRNLKVRTRRNGTETQERGIKDLSEKGADALMFKKDDDGQWNMRDKQLFRPEKITGCAILIYDRRFRADQEAHLKKSLFNVTQMLGIQGMPPDPPVLRKDATGTAYWNHLKEVAVMHKSAKGNMPNLIIVVLPDMAEDIYLRIKNAGDIKIGVATQCLRAFKCGKGNEQYYVNVCLKINAKLGGINVIPKPDTVRFLTDRAIPTIVIGADVQHPGPGNMTRPSHSAVVGSVDSDASKYVATSRAQPCRREMIDDLADMVAHVIRKYMQYRKEVEKNPNPAPRRILFYRDGISEGQFKECKDFEVVQIF
ncbi:hypothetical protein FS837_001553, partial [Tulasnella sp. UAMH 9824]